MGYTDEKHIQILIALLKAHGIKRIVASPGSSNVPLVASMQNDSFFEMVSCVDERSAAYIACGMAAESGDPVVLTCTGATASRNYLPGLTEAYYRNLPILAITASMHTGRIKHLHPQTMDRSVQLNDTNKMSVELAPIQTPEDRWSAEVKVNDAILELRRGAGGPVHINLVTMYSTSFEEKGLPNVRRLHRYGFGYENGFPDLPQGKRAVYVGSHVAWTDRLTRAVDSFCACNDAVVIVDHTSNYPGKYGLLAALVSAQDQYRSPILDIDLLIHIGDVSGSYYRINPKEVWRVSPDGEVRDTFKTLTSVFAMFESSFFEHYSKDGIKLHERFLLACRNEDARIRAKLPELPFSNLWCAQYSSSLIPAGSVIHFGILNSLRSWNYFPLSPDVRSYANTGGFGIDGCVSSLVGGALVDPDQLHFGVVGDLAFFYDLNVLGNRHVGANVRLMIVNNGRGVEFKNYSNIAAQFGDDADLFIAAGGHFGSQSRELVRNYAKDLGFYYLSAESKDEFKACASIFFDPEMSERPMLFEVFTNSRDESDALEAINNIETSIKGAMTKTAKDLLGNKSKRIISNIIRKEK